MRSNIVGKKSKDTSKDVSTYEETLLGLDYGESRIGLAFGRGEVVSPLRIISGKNDEQAIKEISEIVLQNKIHRIVIGVPKRFDNRESYMEKKIFRFGKMLKIILKKPVSYVDEAYTSIESTNISLEQKLPPKNRRRVDDVSAALILRNYYQGLL